MIVILIATIALGMSAPMISRQLKNETLTNIQAQILQRQIDELKSRSSNIPVGAVMFFNLSRCPVGWDPVLPKSDDSAISITENLDYKLRGYYPRIAAPGDADIGYTKNEMVHKHKHVSPFSWTYNDISAANSFRYGPFRNNATKASLIVGDGEYEAISASSNIASEMIITGVLANGDSDNWYLYTSDGMNRYETMRTNGGQGYSQILTCPNKDEDGICEGTDGKITFSYNPSSSKTTTIYNLPVLDNMPLVGDENRPNSFVLLACQRNN